MKNKSKKKDKKLKFIPYYGSKRRMVEKLKTMIPEHSTYIEAFLGSGALMLNHDKSEVEIVNDKDKDIANLFAVMADREKGKQFIEELQTIHYGKQLFEGVKLEKKQRFSQYTEVERAVMQYYLLTSSFNATGKAFAEKRVSSEEEYRKRVNKMLKEVYERMNGVQVLNVDALDLLELFVGDEDAFIFLDPPYLKSVRGKGAGNVYGCEMEAAEHRKMLELIRNAKASLMLCGYYSGEGDLYDKMLIPYGWKRHFIGDFKKSAQRCKERDCGQEYVWTNYVLPQKS